MRGEELYQFTHRPGLAFHSAAFTSTNRESQVSSHRGNWLASIDCRICINLRGHDGIVAADLRITFEQSR